jgi:hypothetical protein
MTPSFRVLLAGLVLVVVAAAIAGGFFLIGPPSEARLHRLDDRRVSDLRELSSAVNVYWTRKRQLPSSLDATMAELYGGRPPVDPDTTEPYGYRAIDGNRYELCAVFDRASQDGAVARGDPFWSHTAGRQCFALDAKDLTKGPGR